MRILIVLAHPEKKSFNAHLAEITRQSWMERGHEVTVLDLYTEDFDPREGSWHYEHRQDADKFDPMQEQRHHWQRQQLPPTTQRHINLLLQADALILHFPFWWFGAPAILKGWMDRVFVYGGLYQSSKRHQNGVMRGKRALLVSTAGASAQACAPNGRDGDMRLLLWPVMYSLHYIGFEVLEPHLIHGVRGGLFADQAEQQRDELKRAVGDYQAKIQQWGDWPLVSFNRDEDFTESQVLKPQAPVHSPFVRHCES
ncbi:NAD(P)H-dependent oxidoreductase [Pseudomonas sp. ADAK18]|uniref:NAD(P)H-dependent oxidoreductase n=1 Tax=Pseudomonas sp. ADAK18 TaxID=2730848 RepID=UPI0014644142|nr:NAD(P)H-dependent oxidoreductase [Pseudomonas sp. ADAK18]QJI28946.1 NAD(P)H-dependent oxidoreductase [Pseudomonas sp. ADAK18]